jgi:membrane protease YdiL (CAAX protease family)
MDQSSLILLPDGRLRAGWRFVIFMLAYVLIRGAVLSLWPLRPENYAYAVLQNILMRGAVTLGLSWAMLRLLEGRPLRAIGIGLDRGWLAQAGGGLAAGAAMVGFTAGIIFLGGGAHFQPSGEAAGAATAQFLRWTPLVLVAAASEELLFRGYPFQVLVEGAGRVPAVGSTALIFGLLHLGNPSSDALSTANTALAGVLFALAYLRAGTLWYAIALHFSWNWTLAAIGFPVSGLNLGNLGWVIALPETAAWLHGGAYGPEGGAACTLVLLLAIAGLWVAPHRLGCPPTDTPAEASGTIHPTCS